jgi:hypothetical protein
MKTRNSLITNASIILLVALLWSCNDTNTPNTIVPKTDYLPLTIGNYWIYHYYKLDYTGAPLGGSDLTDSLVVTDSGTVSGKNAYTLVDFYSDGSKDNNGIYKLVNYDELFKLALKPEWMKIGNLNKNDWHVWDLTILNYPIRGNFPYMIGDSIIDTSADYTNNGYFVTDFNFRIDTNYYSGLEYKLNNDSRITIDYWRKDTVGVDTLVGLMHVYQTQMKVDHYKYVDGIGLVYNQLEPYATKFWTAPNHNSKFPLQFKQYYGYTRLLLRYNTNNKVINLQN